MLTEEDAVAGAMEGVATRAVLSPNDMWQCPDMRVARLELRGRFAVRTHKACKLCDGLPPLKGLVPT